MKEHILGIDQGTSGTKAIVFNGRSEIVSQSYRPLTQYYPRPGWVEHDPAEIFNITLLAARDALRKAAIAPSHLAAVGITNQRDTTTLWNRSTGLPYCRSIVWQDRRTLSIVEQLIKNNGDEITKRTGMLLIPNIAAAKIKWLIENNPDVRKGVKKGDVLFGTVDTWLVWKLSGGGAHVTDYSNASVTLLLNAKTLEYDASILGDLEIPVSLLPALKSSAEIVAHTDPAVFGASVPIAAIVGDQQAAVMGQACLRPGMAKNTYGTGSFFLINTGNRYVPPVGGAFSPVLWKIKAQKCYYALEGMADVSGAAIQWLKEEMGIINESSEADDLAARIPSNEGVYFVPAFVGLGAPHHDSYARGAIFGITRGTSRAHLVRAALEAMAYQVRDALHGVRDSTGIGIDILRADGGASNSDFLMQFQSDILGIPVERPAITETTCLGAAYLAGLAVGFWGSLGEIGRNWKRERCFEPTLTEDERETLCLGWQKAVGRVKNWLR